MSLVFVSMDFAEPYKDPWLRRRKGGKARG